jgi:hypothetical protein
MCSWRARAARVLDGVVGRRRLGQAGEHGGFRDGHVLQRLAEVDLGGGGEPVGPLAQEDLVHIDLEDLLLGEHVLQLERQEHLIDLAGVALLGGEVHIAGHLHGDGGGALALGLPQVGQRGAHHAAVVDAVVLEEPCVLDGQHRVLHHRGNLVDGEQVAPLFAELADQRSVGGDHAQGQLGPVVGQAGDFGQVGVGHGQRDAHGHHHAHNTCHRQSGQTHHQATDPEECCAPGQY